MNLRRDQPGAASVAQVLVVVPAVALTAAVGPAANYIRNDLLFPARENSSTIWNRGWDDIKLNNFFWFLDTRVA